MINEQELSEIRESAKNTFKAFILEGFRDYFTMQYQKTTDSQFYIIAFDNEKIQNGLFNDAELKSNLIDKIGDYNVYLHIVNQK